MNRKDAIVNGYQVHDIEHQMKRRAPWHDYCHPGYYMLTLVVEGRRPLFGRIVTSETMRDEVEGSGEGGEGKGCGVAGNGGGVAGKGVGVAGKGGEVAGKGGGVAGKVFQARVVLSPLGEAIANEEIQKITLHYPLVKVVKLCVMPDHLHIIVHVDGWLKKGQHLGMIVKGFKYGCNKAWWRLAGIEPATESQGTDGRSAAGMLGADGRSTAGMLGTDGRSAAGMQGADGRSAAGLQGTDGRSTAGMQGTDGRSTAGMQGTDGRSAAGLQGTDGRSTAGLQGTDGRSTAGMQGTDGRSTAGLQGADGRSTAGMLGADIRSLRLCRRSPKAERANRGRPGLFEEGYNDRLLFDGEQMDRWKHYLDDNPRRLAIKRQHPDLFIVKHNMRIAGHDCQIVGNQFLLNIPDKVAVIVHRRYTEEEYQRLTEQWLACGERGGVLVSAAISPKERAVLNEARLRGYNIIWLNENGFSEFYKPTGAAFDACSAGRLLQVCPWMYHTEKRVITRRQCTTLNDLAIVIAVGET